MDRELACEIVKDLLPLYVDGMVSDVSKKCIKNHLEHCTGCTEIYQDMSFQLELETKQPEVQEVKRFLNKTKRMYLLYALGILSAVSILVCMIVDLAVNKGITWSLIVDGAVLFADAFLYVLAVCRKNKGYLAMAVLSIGTFCLLCIIQAANYYLMGIGTFWIFRYGIPILLLWLGLLWVPVILRAALKWNIWDCIALFLLLAAAGNYVTKVIIGDYVWLDVYYMRGFFSNVLGELAGSVIFFMIGRVKSWRK